MSNIQIGAAPLMDNAAYDIPCGWACTQPCDNMYFLQPERICEQGLTLLQLHMLIAIWSRGGRVTSYRWLSRSLGAKLKREFSAESARGVVDRLVTRGYVQRKPAQEGLLRGLRYYVVAQRACPFLARALCQEAVWDTQEATHDATQPKRIDRSLSIYPLTGANAARQKLETLADSDIELFWPELFRQGFRATQIRQILASLDKLGIKCDDVAQGLGYAEWLLAADCLCDKHGDLVENPVSWVFKTLSRQGYYPRPPGYVSPEEQAARDAAEEKKRLAAAVEELHEAEFCAWSSQLNPEERIGIIQAAAGGNPFPMPDSVRLKAYFDKQVWPEIQNRHEKEG